MELSIIVQKFLNTWEHAGIVDGVLLTGSRSVGNALENSDIDLQIILSDDTLRERGNKIVDGYLVEYFANPTAKIQDYLRFEATQYHRPTIRMYATGQILIDRDGMLAEAKHFAEELLNSPYPPMTSQEIEAAKYSIWDCQDDLVSLCKRSDDSFRYVYHLNLNRVLMLYSRYCGVELTSASKQLRQMEDAEFREKYQIEEYPDQIFAKLFCECLRADETETCFAKFTQLTEYVLRKMGGFNIDGWRSRIKA